MPMITTEYGLRFVLVAPGKWRCLELPALKKNGPLFAWEGSAEIYETLSDALEARRGPDVRPRLRVVPSSGNAGESPGTDG